MTKAGKRFVAGALALVVAGGIASETYRFLCRRALALEADQAKSAAMTYVSPVTTPDDARHWLEANGYRVIVWNPHDPRGFVGMQDSSTDGKHYIVQGQRQIRAGNWLLEPMWLHVTFRFTINGAFRDVQSDPFPIEVVKRDSPHNQRLQLTGDTRDE